MVIVIIIIDFVRKERMNEWMALLASFKKIAIDIRSSQIISNLYESFIKLLVSNLNFCYLLMSFFNLLVVVSLQSIYYSVILHLTENLVHFDTIGHKILLDKLVFLGFSNSAISWFKSYLSNRSFIVNVENDYSVPGNLTCGVPYGSILGPFLFLLYVDDIPSAIKC